MTNWRFAFEQLARVVRGQPLVQRPLQPPPGVHRPGMPVYPAYIPEQNPLGDEVADQGRWEAAQKLMGEDCYGYLLLTVHKEAIGPVAEIRLAQDLDPTWWPAIATTLETIVAVERGQR